MAVSPPRPPWATTWSAVSAATKSRSGASEVPPGLKARRRISSCLNVVGASTTRTPFDNVHSVIPRGLDTLFVTAPGLGSVSMSGRALTSSTYAVSSPPPAPLMTAASAASSGTFTPVFSGARTATTRLRSGTQSRARLLMSAIVISGRNRWTRPFSYAMPGIGSCCMKLRMYSSASDPDVCSSLDAASCAKACRKPRR